MVRGQPDGVAVGLAGLLVGLGEEDDVALERDAAAFELAQDHELRPAH